jgi:hypothetical protein
MGQLSAEAVHPVKLTSDALVSGRLMPYDVNMARVSTVYPSISHFDRFILRPTFPLSEGEKGPSKGTASAVSTHGDVI